MTRASCMLFVLLLCGAASGQETAVFTPPQAYPADRYQAMWNKNPFTLKTAPAAVENVSLAKDLAIVSHYGDVADPTVVIVNMKTHERKKLKKGTSSDNGMTLTDVKLGDTRKDTTVTVTLGTETMELSYNSDYMSQVAATKGAQPAAAGRPGPGGVSIPGMPANMQTQQRGPGMPPNGVKMPTAPAAMVRPSTAGLPAGGARPVAMPGGVNIAAGVGATNSVNAAVTPSLNSSTPPPQNGTSVPGTSTADSSGAGTVAAEPEVQTPQSGPLVSQVNPNAPQQRPRTRMVNPATN